MLLKKKPQQNLQTVQLTQTTHTTLCEIQYQYFNDTLLSQDILTKMTNSLPPNSDNLLMLTP